MNKVDGRMEKKKFKKLLNLIEKHSNAIKANEDSTSIDIRVEKYNEFVKFLNMSEEGQDEYTKSF